MRDGDGLLKAILADPDDDTPRLVYADWLDENGEPARAEFVRVQVELAKYPDQAFLDNFDAHPETCTCGGCLGLRLRRREGELLRDFNRTLLEPRPPGMFSWQHNGRFGWGVKESGYPGRDFPITFSRGFITTLICTAADWHAHGDAILARHPVREVTLTTTPRLVATRGGLYAKLSGRWKELAYGAGRTWSQMAPDLLAAEWPGVAFNLPRVSPAAQLASGST
jgi:uncharacterized protein (TIGR02996 family)